MSHTIDEEWNDCDFVGTIKKYDLEPKAPSEPVENLDDYDARNGFGSKMCIVKSRFNYTEV